MNRDGAQTLYKDREGYFSGSECGNVQKASRVNCLELDA